ncbi:hypothetical protein CLU79DRAFT_831051 [Phycomyces nitens]|nr:hypothetical protein CLU79DRAFT_831051 [Phycomyces nitens]
MDTDDLEKLKDRWPPRLADLYEHKLPPSHRPGFGHYSLLLGSLTQTPFRKWFNEHDIIADLIWRRGDWEFKDGVRFHLSDSFAVRLVS